MAMMMDCNASPATEIVVTIDSSGDSQANFKWAFHAAAQSDPDAPVAAKGDLDFHKKNQPIHVTMTLNDTDPNRVFFQGNGINVFGYADAFDDGYSAVQPVAASHPQFSNITLSNGGKTVSFCYANHAKPGEPGNSNHYKISRYTIYLGEAGNTTAYLPFWIDPKISNR